MEKAGQHLLSGLFYECPENQEQPTELPQLRQR